MQTTHKQEHGHEHTHGHARPNGATAAPHTAGRLIHWARWYDVLLKFKFLGQLGKLREVPLDLAALRRGERVLDVGCGTGDLALAAARRVGPGGQVVGIDAAPEMIAVAQRKARRMGRRVQFRLEPVEALSFPDGSFDVVLSSLMMHHLPGDLKQRALGEIHRVLRPGGRIVIIDIQPTTRPPRPWEPGWLVTRLHRQHAHAGEPPRPAGPGLPDLLREAGFTAVESGPTRYDWIGYARARVPG
jgi:ubiquinone/menaquinone biosynthesis C-methylase UbiE